MLNSAITVWVFRRRSKATVARTKSAWKTKAIRKTKIRTRWWINSNATAFNIPMLTTHFTLRKMKWMVSLRWTKHRNLVKIIMIAMLSGHSSKTSMRRHRSLTNIYLRWKTRNVICQSRILDVVQRWAIFREAHIKARLTSQKLRKKRTSFKKKK